MRIGTVTVPASFEMIVEAGLSIAYAQRLNPAELASAIEAQNTPAKLRAHGKRLTRAAARRREAERLYLEEWFGR